MGVRFYLSHELNDWVQAEAERLGITYSALIERAVKELRARTRRGKQ